MILDIKNPIVLGSNEFNLDTNRGDILFIKKTTNAYKTSSKLKKVSIPIKKKREIQEALTYFGGHLQGLVAGEDALSNLSISGEDSNSQSVKITLKDESLPEGEQRIFDVYLSQNDLADIVGILHTLNNKPVKIN